MIIPIKCFTCGKVLGDKYLYFKNEVKKMKVGANLNENSVIYLSENIIIKKPQKGRYWMIWD